MPVDARLPVYHLHFRQLLKLRTANDSQALALVKEPIDIHLCDLQVLQMVRVHQFCKEVAESANVFQIQPLWQSGLEGGEVRVEGLGGD